MDRTHLGYEIRLAAICTYVSNDQVDHTHEYDQTNHSHVFHLVEKYREYFAQL